MTIENNAGSYVFQEISILDKKFTGLKVHGRRFCQKLLKALVMCDNDNNECDDECNRIETDIF